MFSVKQSYRAFYGEGLIETLYFRKGVIYLLEAHWQRLTRSADALKISFSCNLSTWKAVLHDTMSKANVSEGGLRCLLISGDAKRGLESVSDSSWMDIEPFSYQRAEQKAVRIWSVPWKRDNRNMVYQHKSIQYLEQIQALRQAQVFDCDDALFWDMHDYALETTTANILAWDGTGFYTPSKEQAVITGVFLDALQNLLSEQGYNFQYAKLNRSVLHEMKSVWLCNSLRGLYPIKSLDGETLAFDRLMHERLLELIRF